MTTAILPMTRRLRLAAVQERCGGVNESTIYRWMACREFPRPIKLGRRVALWDEAQVEAWIQLQQVSVKTA